MFTVLLSGGSGKRLWPLSNDQRSKQYIKLFENESDNTNEKISMVQRVVNQIKAADLYENLFICAGKSQLDIIGSQLQGVNVAIEPERRNTFAAVVISCAYAVSKMKASLSDVITILPVDPYTDECYFKTLASLEEKLLKSGADIALMGAVPDSPSTQYGYIIPDKQHDGYSTVKCFHEKPDLETAKELLKQNAVFNCGVFCFKLELMEKILKEFGLKLDYDLIYNNYNLLPKISFDYQVLEKSDNMIMVPFTGMWKDIGTWNSLTSELNDEFVGNVVMDDCQNTTVINMLDNTIVASGLNDIVAVASADGIIISDKAHTEDIRKLVDKLDDIPKYEECSWGTSEVIKSDSGYRVKYVHMKSGTEQSIWSDQEKIFTIISGKGEITFSDSQRAISAGDVLKITAEEDCKIISNEDLEYIDTTIF